jgi:very-short-patch-repair endonuclease
VVGGREVLPFAWPDARVALEYDGVWHGEGQHVGRDRRRLNRLSDAGWTVVFVTAADLHHPELLLARIARLLVSRSVGSRSSVGW